MVGDAEGDLLVACRRDAEGQFVVKKIAEGKLLGDLHSTLLQELPEMGFRVQE